MLFLGSTAAGSTTPADLNVPADYPTIQTVVNVAQTNDIIHIAPAIPELNEATEPAGRAPSNRPKAWGETLGAILALLVVTGLGALGTWGVILIFQSLMQAQSLMVQNNFVFHREARQPGRPTSGDRTVIYTWKSHEAGFGLTLFPCGKPPPCLAAERPKNIPQIS